VPYPLQFLDMEHGELSTTSFPVNLGANWQPGDARIIFYSSWNSNPPPSITVPSGWSKLSEAGGSAGSSDAYLVILFRLLAAGATGGTATVSSLMLNGQYTAVTVRNFYPSQTTLSPNSFFGSGGSTSSVALPGITATGPGVDLVFFNTFQNAIGLPSGYTEITSADNSGSHYAGDTPSTQLGYILCGKSVAGAGALPTVAVQPALTTSLAYGFRIGLRTNPDITATIGVTTTEADTANAVTPSLQALVTRSIGTAVTEVDTAGQVFSPLTGYRISEPITLPGTPLTASRVKWSARTFAAGSSVLVETSIDGGVTWQAATNNGPIPNLRYGNTTATAVMSRVTLTRALKTDPTPRVASLELLGSFDSGTDEMVSLGVFMINGVRMTESGGNSGSSGSSGGGGDGITSSGGGASGSGLAIELTGVDLSGKISRNKWLDVYYIPAGTNYATAIQLLLDNRLPGLAYNFATTEQVTPLLLFGTSQDSDPWKDAQELADAIGFELFFDARGICTLRQAPDPQLGVPVWDLDDTTNPTVVAIDRGLTDDQTFNYIIVQGVSANNVAPVQAVAFDNDPSSRTYVYGPYGFKPYIYQSNGITTVAQAQAAANALLNIVKGASETVALTMVPNPALEPGDISSVSAGNAKAHGNYVLNSLTTPLSAAEAQVAIGFRQT